MAIRKKIKSKLFPITSLGVLGALGMLFLAVSAQAGPITNPGGSPYVKLAVYQGLVSIVPGGAGNSIMEIGNAGRDIASTGELYLRPGTGQSVRIAPQDTTTEGGELQLQGAASYPTWANDIWQNRWRIHTNGSERIVIDGTAGGNVYLPTGQLCFGNVGSTNCISSGSGSTPSLNTVLGAGNNSALSAALGAAVSPTAKLVVNNGTTSLGGATDAITAYANTTGSAVYAQQNNATGWAGYFSGNVNITGTLTLGGVVKPTPGIQVCQIGSNTCLGRYLYTNWQGRNENSEYCYENASTGAVACVDIYVAGTIQTCTGGNHLRERTTTGRSYFSNFGCTQLSGEYMSDTDFSSGVRPYGNSGVWTCVNNSTQVLTPAQYRNSSVPGCANYSGGSITVRSVGSATPVASFSQQYELR